MTKTESAAFHQITWAFDPLGDGAHLQTQTARAIRSLASSMRAKVEPVAVLNVWIPSADSPRPPYGAGGNVSPGGEKRLKSFFRRVRFPGLRPARVLLSHGNSLHASVQILLDHARRDGSQLLVVGTHARKGVPRLFFGSFAETLVLNSSLPVLVVNPEAKCPAKIETVLFPTDFSVASRRAFESTVETARWLGARLLLFHSLEDLYSGPGAPPIPPSLMKEFAQDRTEQGTEWVNHARAQGVATDFRLSRSTAPIDEAILAMAKRAEASLIAMASQSGAVRSALWGSVTRKLIRSADCPVLVIPPPQKRGGSSVAN